MPNTRIQVEQRTDRAPETTQKLIDTFVAAKPDPTAGDKAAGIAKALGAAMPSAQKMAVEFTEDEAHKGAEAFATGMLEDGTKINKGEIEKTQSPYFMRGFNLAQGKADALQMGMEVEQAWQQSGARTNPDPNAFSSFLSGEFQKRMGAYDSKNGDWRAGFTSAVGQVRGDLVAKQKTAMNQFLTEQSLSQLNKEVTYELNQFNSKSPGYDGSDFDSSRNLRNTIEATATRFISRGLRPNEANAAAVESVIAHARETGDASLLDHVPDKLLNNDRKLALVSAKHAIRAEADAKSELEYRQGERAKKAKLDTMETDFIGKALSAPGYTPSKAELQDYQRNGGNAISLIHGLRSLAEPVPVPPAVEARALLDLSETLDRGDYDGAKKLLFSGRISSRSAFSQAMSDMDHARKVEPYMQAQGFQDAKFQLEEVLKTATTAQASASHVGGKAPALIDDGMANSIRREMNSKYREKLSELIEANAGVFRPSLAKQAGTDAYLDIEAKYGRKLGVRPRDGAKPQPTEPSAATPASGSNRFTTGQVK